MRRHQRFLLAIFEGQFQIVMASLGLLPPLTWPLSDELLELLAFNSRYLRADEPPADISDAMWEWTLVIKVGLAVKRGPCVGRQVATMEVMGSVCP